MSEGLKLKAAEAEDVTILSSALEGAITSPGEMGYASQSRSFTLTASRFMWEKKNKTSSQNKRIRTGLHCADVLSVKALGLSQDKPTEAMELLDIECKAGEDGQADLLVHFAGGATLKLSVECIDITLTDVGDAWDTDHVPHHEDAEPDTSSPA